MLATLLIGAGVLIAILRFTDIPIDASTYIGAILSFSLSYILYRISKYRSVLSLVKTVPGRTVWLTPFSSLPAMALPSIPYIAWGGYFGYLDIESARAKTYDKWNTSVYRIAGISQPHITFKIADPESIKYILDLDNRALFPKWLDIYKAIKIFGVSLIASENEVFRRHRKIVAKAFTADVNQLVWETSTDVARVWVKELAAKSDDKGLSTEDGVVRRCFDLALYVICATAYGVKVPILSEQMDPTSSTSQFKEALEGTCSELMTLIVSMNYTGKLPFKKVQNAYTYKANLDKAMKDLVAERRRAIADGTGGNDKDLLSCLIKANDAEESGMDKDAETGRKVEKLSEAELLGNIWLFLLAGHETSSHTLSYTLALLAIYPEEQEKLYAHIMDVCPEASDASHTIPYSLYPHFIRALACIYESLRRYPAVIDIPKMVKEDQDVMLPTSERGPLKGEKVFMPRNSKIFLDVWAMQHDPAVWKDPYTFNPDRFIDTETYTWPRDLLFSFSGGARSCTGQNFARAELVCLLINIVRSYKITLPPAVAASGVKKMEIERLLLKNTLLVSLAPDEFKLGFKAR